MRTIYNTQTTTESAYLLTPYERLGNIDLEAYAIDEVIRPYLESLDTSALVEAYNDYANENCYEPYHENDEDLFTDMEPLEAVRCTYYGNYRFMDTYAQFNGYGNIDTFDAYKVEKEILSDSDFLYWVYKNYYFDDEEDEREAEALNLVKMGY